MNIRVTFSALLLLAASMVLAQEYEAVAPPPQTGEAIPVPMLHWAPGTHDNMKAVVPGYTIPRNHVTPFSGYFTMPENPVWQGPFFDPSGVPRATTVIDLGGSTDSQPLLQNFHGQAQTNLTPPDTDIAAGPERLITVVNSAWAVWDKCGNKLLEQNISDFLGDTTSFLFDPHTTYDPWNGRWLMQWHARRSATSEAYLVICISATGNPLGGWWFYYFPAVTGSGADTAWNDYYDLGYGRDCVYSAGNQFRFSNNTFTNSTIHTYNKSEIYNGLPAFQTTDTGLTYASGGLAFGPRAAKMHVVFTPLSSNLVANPGFEDHPSTWEPEWSTFFASIYLAITTTSGNFHSGAQGLQIGSTSSTDQDEIRQTIATTIGTHYRVTFYGKQAGGDATTSNTLVSFAGVTVYSGLFPTTFFGRYVADIVATGTSSVLRVRGWNSPSFNYVDDFDVTVAPGIDGMFVASRPGGGTQVSFYRLADPLGTHTFASFEIPVGAYSVPPDAAQPDGSLLDTIDCRIFNLVVTGFGAPGNCAFCGLNTANAGLSAAQIFVFDPFSATTRQNTIYFATGYSYWFPAASADYNVNGIWTFARCRNLAGQFAEQRYIDWVQGTLGASSSQLKAGVGNYHGGRWGDYFGADLDWGDYYGSGSPDRKHWMFGEYGFSNGAWDTWIGATAVNATAGVMAVSGGPFNTVGLVGGPFAPSMITYTLSNAGTVGYSYMLTGVPAWLDASATQGDVPSGATRDVDISTNAATNALAFGRYNANLTFENCYTGATIVKAASAEVDAIIHPTSISIGPGIILSGNNASLGASDDNRLVMRPGVVISSTQAPIQLVCDMTAPAASVGSMILHIESSVNQVNIGETLRLFNWGTAAYEQVDFRNPTTTDTFVNVPIGGNPNRFIGAGNAVRAKVDYKTTGPILSYPWQARIDELFVRLTPP